MDPDLIPMLLAVGTALSLGGMALVGIRMWVSRFPKPDLDELAEAISERLRQEIREEVSGALESRAAELEELHERVDFAERLLTKGQLREVKESTPV
jgi:uncharacterized Zn finger protein